MLDIGSTDNFIKNGVAKQFGMAIEHRPGLQVALPNEGRLDIDGVFKRVRLEVQVQAFIVDLYAIPLDGFDIVLGYQWLNKLDQIMWEFEHDEMIFMRNSDTVTWLCKTSERTIDKSELFHLDANNSNLSYCLKNLKTSSQRHRVCPLLDHATIRYDCCVILTPSR